ncbi:hypothetical protein TNCV_183321 [Trichonephila clavipes]|nr:hypothetical protein TNCV_183321 [Trichonephila clavipes]
MFRSGGLSNVKPPVLSSQESLVLVYRPTDEIPPCPARGLDLGPVAVGSLVVRASESRPEVLSSMPPNTLRVHTEYVLAKSVNLKVLWVVAAESRGAGSWRISLSSSFMPKLWRWR